ncbi:unnamed protein product [Pocillopora meandrina]|uniref:Exonuclease domain-containing protein n=1 Tax=Pocillopora meandrina TaxID=46732 RepID=A0AAU9VPN6_9CNID|nr:unnamed protein product [Pocillopora meandrina]
MPAEISRTELKGYEEITPPYTIRPKIVHLQYDSKQKYQFIIFDTETTCTRKLAEMCQLSAVSENGKHEFSTYILPKSNTSYSAYLVNGMTIKTIKGVGTLYQGNIPVESITIEQALRDFLTFITKVKSSERHENQITVLIGHNSATFHVPILLRNTLELDSGGYCKPNQSSIYNHLFKEQFDAYDALEDVRALRKILFESSLSLSRKNIVKNSSVISAPHAVANMLYLDQRHELLLTFSDNLFNETDTGPIKRSMAQNIADSGLSYDDLHKLYIRFGKIGLVAILSDPPTTSSAKTPRVTWTKRILAAIV